MINVFLDEEMDMPCLCDCGQWFDLTDGVGSRHSNKVVCSACGEKEREEQEREEEITELNEAIEDAIFTIKESLTRLHELAAPIVYSSINIPTMPNNETNTNII